MSKKVSVFSDFDATITIKDVGDELFKKFGDFEPYYSQLTSGMITIADYYKRVTSSLNNDLSESEIKNFARTFDIDSNFAKFAGYCKTMDVELKIVSDGFDIYIDPILEKENLSGIRYSSNQLFKFDDNWLLNFPLASESCGCLCASCKRNAILSFSEPDSIIVYIGDGYSDFCAAKHSDVVFAKGVLAAYCNKERIPHFPYNNFFDVYRLFRNFFENNKFKVRNQAKLLRKKAFEIE